MSAGMFDRAERIFLEIVDLSSGTEVLSLQGLLDIYQQEKAWEKAILVIKKLEHSTGESMHVKTAHYHCEIAQKALKAKSYEAALQATKQALAADRRSVRASLMQAEIDIHANRYKQAIASLKRISQQDAAFLPEVVEPLVRCHQALDSMDECIGYLLDTIEANPRSSIIFVVAEYLRKEKGVDLAIDFVAEKLNKHPSIRGLNRLICWHLETAHGKVRDRLQMLYDITSKFLDKKPIYRCSECGFGGKHLHWHCPSCKQWGKMKPVHGLEGD